MQSHHSRRSDQCNLHNDGDRASLHNDRQITPESIYEVEDGVEVENVAFENTNGEEKKSQTK